MTNKEIVENYLRDYNQKDINGMLKSFDDEVIFESVSNTNENIRTNNKKELHDLASASAEYFSERRQRVLRWIINGDQIAVEIDFWCKLAKDLPNGKKAGEEMTLRGVSFFTFKGRLITSLTDFM